MSDVLWFQGRFTNTDDRVLTVLDRSVLFGDGVYEVLKFIDRAPLLAGAHWTRLCRSLELLEIPNPWTRDEYTAMLSGIMERTTFSDGIVYLQVSRGEGRRSHEWPAGMEPTAFAYSATFAFPSEEIRRDGVKVIMVPDERWARCNIKSVNLLPNVLAKVRASREGARESLFVEDGEIVEGGSSNVFAVIDDTLCTRPLGAELLPGTVRFQVIELAEAAGFEVAERPIRSEALCRAAEVFICSTTFSVLPVTTVNELVIGDGRRGPVTTRVQEAFAEFEIEEARRWREQR